MKATSTSSNKGRRLMPRNERREGILNAAAAAFAKGGFSGTSMDEIAEGAGITRLIVYRHFDSKEKLYRGVLGEVVDRMKDVFVSGLSTDTPAGIGVHAFMSVARERPDGFRLLWRHAAHEPAFAAHANELSDKTVGAVAVMLSQVIDDKVVVAWGSRTVVSFLVEATLNWLDRGTATRDGEFEVLTTGALRSMIASWVEISTGKAGK